MAKAGKWSTLKTTWITIACGIGHVSSSIILGIIGIAMGIAIVNLELIESIRGEIASWLLISFGLIYLIWGIRKLYRNKPHTHFHTHADGTVHTHNHIHKEDHTHVHSSQEKKKNITPWILFTIFVFGPCEALIPILMYPGRYRKYFRDCDCICSVWNNNNYNNTGSCSYFIKGIEIYISHKGTPVYARACRWINFTLWDCDKVFWIVILPHQFETDTLKGSKIIQ